MEHFRSVSGATAKSILHEADWSEMDDTGVTALHIITQCHAVDVLEQAVQSGAVLDAGGSSSADRARPLGSAVHVAAHRGSVDHLRVLSAAGASVTLLDASSSTPLHIAAQRNDAPFVAALTQAGARLEARDMLGCTALHAAAAAGGHEATNALLGAGANAAALDDRQRAPFQVVGAGAVNRSALVDKLKRAAEAGGWAAPTPEDAHVNLPALPSSLGGSGQWEAAPTPAVVDSAGAGAGKEEEEEGDLTKAQLAALTVSALHEKIQSSLESGAIGGYEDIYRALDEPGAGWFEGHHLSTVCNEIDIPVEDAVIPDMMALIAAPGGRQTPLAGHVTRITWDEFRVFCEQSRGPVEGL